MAKARGFSATLLTMKINLLSPSTVTACGLGILSGFLYFLLGKFEFLFSIPNTALSVFWIADAGTLAILLLSPRRYWFFIVVGSWLGDFPNELAMSGSFRNAVILATIDSMMVLAPSFVIRRYAGDITVRNCLRWFIWLIGSYCLFSVPLAGFVAAITVYGNDYTFIEIANNTRTWFLSSAPSVLILVPLIIAGFETIFTKSVDDVNWRNGRMVIGFSLLLFLIVASGYYEFVVYYFHNHETLSLYVPILFVISYTYGLIGAGVSSAVILIMTGFGALYGIGRHGITENLIELQSSVLANITGAMLLACVTTHLRFINLKTRQQLVEIENIYKHSPVGLCLMDRNYRYIRINQMLADINHVAIEDHIGRTIFEILPGDISKQVHELYKPVFEEGEFNKNIEVFENTSEGLHAWLCHFIPVKDKKDEVTHLIGVVQDVTKYKKLEMELRESEDKAKYEERRFRDIAESTADLFFEFNENGCFTYLSKFVFLDAEHYLGKTVKEIISSLPEQYQIDELNELVLREFDQMVMEQKPIDGIEFSLIYHDGKTEYVSIRGVPIFNEKGYKGYRGSASRITSKVREEVLLAEVELSDAANQAKGEFLANMSHEIRTPMSAIIGLSDLALAMEMSPKLRDYLDKIAHASKSLLRIINDILDFSKIEAGRLELEVSEFFLRDVFDHLADLFRAKFTRRHIELIMDISEECEYRLFGDSLRLEQILMNLMGNALKFTEEGEVEVQVKTIQRSTNNVTLEFSVRDTGMGMDDKNMDKLFLPFSQVDNSITRKFGGTGLGLSISKKLVDMMGGNIWVHSEIGHGSVFSFTSLFQCEMESSTQDMIPPKDMERLKVLVVDDNKSARNSAKKVLEMFNFSVNAVSSGQEAIDAITKGISEGNPCQLVLMDWLMPGINGIETAHKIRASIPFEFSPKTILAIPYHREEELRLLGNAAGVNAYLSKPINCSILFDTIMKIFEKDVAKVYKHRKDIIDTQEIVERIGGSRILLVEDNTINQQVAREILEGIGLIVEIANDGLEAVAKIMGSIYDVVLMDIQMPRMDGYQASRQIRSDIRFGKLPIIAMTAHNLTGDREKCLDSGMNDYVSKPINRLNLYTALMKWIPHREGLGLAFSLKQDKDTEETWYLIPGTLPGIAVDVALERLNDNHRLYHSLLVEFSRDYSQSGKQIRTFLTEKREKNIDSAEKLAHTIKGIAGNISAARLFNAALVLEKSLKLSTKEQFIALESFENALNEVMGGIKEMIWKEEEAVTREPPSDVEVHCIDMEKIIPVMNELFQQLKRKAYEAQESFDTLKSLLTNIPAEIKWEMKNLEEHIERIAFKDAQQSLEIISKFLGTDLEAKRT